METLFNLTKRILTIISVLILSSLAIIIIISIFTRFLGKSLYWYDEISAILLAWLTFYGAALSALNRSHMGFGNFIASLPINTKKIIFYITEIFIIGFFILLAWAGFYVLSIFGDETLTSLDFIPLSIAQSALPIGCILFIIAEILSIPKALSSLIKGKTQDDEEIEQALKEVDNNEDIKMAREKLQ
ncbi:TRAP transporter small permease [Pasteurella canis]|uniref:TRAP transporter small permease n=1 Tax=Pasteurella canis TaxID=753 RepID=UPI000D8D72A3|nr:TRAP transporter small permease [Pasteurella canis]UAY77041.1 TRAP transporter small permease [Pasteurella canis]UDW83093.1 TRAP transporter small permease [Pasteurella canis]SPY32702.1 tripartite ATP-independent periplasmic transporter, DctQ component [Pasteurella canis]